MELPNSLWANLPAYGQLYLKYELGLLTTDQELVNYFHWLLNESQETKNEARKLCLDTVARYIYEKLTNRCWLTKQFETIKNF